MSETHNAALPSEWRTGGASVIAQWRRDGLDYAADVVEAYQAECTRLRVEMVKLAETLADHRVAAAILVGTLASAQPESLEWACAPGQQPTRTATATRKIVEDVRRYDAGDAASLWDEVARLGRSE